MNVKNCVVLGGAGDVGEGIVRHLRAAGHTVAVPSRSADKLSELEKTTAGPGTLITRVGEIGETMHAEDMAGSLERDVGPFDLVVASIGGWWSGPPLLEMSMNDWHQIIKGSLTSHLAAARAFLPRLRSSGQYLFINGAGGIMPVPGSGPVSVAAAGQEMLKSVLAAENQNEQLSISALMLMTPIITRSRTSGEADWLSADDVGRYVVHLLDHPPKSGDTIKLANMTEAYQVT